MRDVADDIQPANPFFLQEGDRMGIGLGEHRHQHIGTRRLGLAGPQNMVDRPLDHTRET